MPGGAQRSTRRVGRAHDRGAGLAGAGLADETVGPVGLAGVTRRLAVNRRLRPARVEQAASSERRTSKQLTHRRVSSC